MRKGILALAAAVTLGGLRGLKPTALCKAEALPRAREAPEAKPASASAFCVGDAQTRRLWPGPNKGFGSLVNSIGGTRIVPCTFGVTSDPSLPPLTFFKAEVS